MTKDFFGTPVDFRVSTTQLSQERKRLEQLKKRLDRAFTGTANLYGDLQGLIGNARPEIKYLELTDD